MIPEDQIRNFLPIHELDELTPIPSNAPLSIGADDLFLMSQLRAPAIGDPAIGDKDAVMVSKKLSYQNFSGALSNDFDIGPIKLSVHGLCANVNDLQTDFNRFRNTTTNNINGLCTAIQLSTSTLSTYTETCCNMLSTMLIYGEQTCCLTERTEDPSNPANFPLSITMNNGKITNIDRIGISDLIVPKDWRLAIGGVTGHKITNDITGTLTVNNTTAITCNVLSDSYVNCCISALEDDSYGPLNVWLSSKESAGAVLYETLNNPGGFSGKDFYNYYHFGIPVKTFSGGNTCISVKYANPNNKFKKGTSYSFSFYTFYAVPSKDDLDGYVKKPSPPPPAATTDLNVYKLKYNGDGLITNASAVYYGPATYSNAGLLKVNSNFSHPWYGLQISSNGFGYIEVPSATSSTYGTIKLNELYANTDTSEHRLVCGLRTDGNGKGLTYIPWAQANNYGVVMLSGDVYYDINSNKYMSLGSNISGAYYGVGRDGVGHTHVKVPYAQCLTNGERIPGVIKTGVPDTTRIRVTRSVYVDTDGIAKVNVVTPLGVGMFNNETDGIGDDRGYDIIVNVPMSSPSAIAGEKAKDFQGIEHDLSGYGSKICKTNADINGFFMATFVYEGTKNTQTDTIQVICDGILVTTVNLQNVKPNVNAQSNQKFTYSSYLGLFPGDESNKSRRFAIVTSGNIDSDDKIYFLIREANRV